MFTDFVAVNPEGDRQWDKLFDSKCIPCGFRLSLDAQVLSKFADLGDGLWQQMIGWPMRYSRKYDYATSDYPRNTSLPCISIASAQSLR